MLGNHGRGLTKALFTRPALALGRLGVTPNMLTVTGTILSVTAAVTLLPRGHFVVGPLVLLVVLVADSFDGILARATARSSVFGAFLDSTMDRLADGAVLGSLAAWAALSMPAGTLRTTTIVAALAAMILAATVPYARARAESIGATAKVGIAERTDRLLVALGATFVVGLGAPQWVLTAALGYVAIASFITVIQRVWTVYRQTQRTGEPA
ncbi:phosphatidylinositol phosphate synthase [Actinomyces naeslundii]|jgi:CDP-alcohol phosphatidyltransferase|uniref:phosphatidylinositol phosphate synthase n=1 Tax=Actinomyces naeslundii TaxID=1655 RepID=UPI00096E208B|nr:CDP-alcohol phosphatidyltransferase family protein [Actinomyces naeslundii]OMG24600.1 CDP-alcohol phosphatidyltransferase [Actinomyces naeslundii]OMG28919.1 CDP-alcohol phosphatidyltransferase [Actinomyces naeslundii]OMG29259.1 CDP-alcohol phosphatidyltransferase [Actinomyces naeslundii]OMG34802.1 CDP-alcohol phosphatidyltransferase [Actinomyces naeslundii]OMG40650.1 CDP-alcohol phosphatidyltransferase [Actinomyces naeslundii]